MARQLVELKLVREVVGGLVSEWSLVSQHMSLSVWCAVIATVTFYIIYDDCFTLILNRYVGH